MQRSQPAHDILNERSALERAIIRRGDTVPTTAELKEHNSLMWKIVSAFDAVHPGALDEKDPYDPVYRPLIDLMMRSELGWRARYKPHGYSGDFRLMELFYDLENTAGHRQGRTAGENLIDYVLAHSDGVRFVRERARKLETTLVTLGQNGSEERRVLDVGGGGARYIRRAFNRLSPPYPKITIFDQDLAVPQFWAHEVSPEFDLGLVQYDKPANQV